MDKFLALQEFTNDLLIRNFSKNTLESYLFQLNQYFNYFEKVPPVVDVSQIRSYLLYLKIQKKYSTSTLNLAYTAIQVFHTRILQQEWPVKVLGRPKVTNKLPVILTQNEIKQLLTGINNLKHRTILSLIYSSGLRVSELINLTPANIDSTQMYVMIRAGKGNLDRTTLLSPYCLALLREYYKIYQPQQYLFNGIKKASPYSETSIRNILKQAATNAGIKKKYHFIRSGIALQHIYWKTELICSISKNF